MFWSSGAPADYERDTLLVQERNDSREGLKERQPSAKSNPYGSLSSEIKNCKVWQNCQEKSPFHGFNQVCKWLDENVLPCTIRLTSD